MAGSANDTPAQEASPPQGAQDRRQDPRSRRHGTGPSKKDGPIKPVSRRRATAEWATVLVVAIVASILVRAFALETFFIPSQSMEPTLRPGDRVLVNKLTFDLRPPHTGDVIVFRRPPRDISTIDDLIKRVIAGPGQLIYVAHCRVYVDGKELSRHYLPRGWQNPGSEYCTVWDGPGMLALPDPYRVPAHSYFVMGDNRKDSDDSRFWGPVPASYIVGHAFAKVWPPSRVGSL